jgi:thiol-disulfide isomerase/thioredoxin
MRVRLILPALITATVVALAGCGSAGQSGTDGKAAAGKAPAAKAADAKAPATGAAAQGSAGSAVPGAMPGAVPANLKFTATTLDGKTFDAANLAGHPTVLWFWAPWCATCAGQSATVAELATEYQGKVDIVGVAGMGEEKEMREFVSEFEVGGITHLSDKAGVVWKRFGITQQSVYVLLDRTGEVVAEGWMDSQQFTRWVAHLAKA